MSNVRKNLDTTLQNAVEALNADQDAALAAFSSGEEGFKDRDLYPYCGDAEGYFSAHPSLVGESLMTLQDKRGRAFGEAIYASAKDGEVSEVEYMWPRPGEEEPVQKVALVTKVGDQVCAVGYYVQ
ncbi:MAG: cache domain-containing protein [Geminicoccaceae bacterium]